MILLTCRTFASHPSDANGVESEKAERWGTKMRSEFHFLLLAIYARVCEFHLELLPSTWEKDKEEFVFFRKRYTRIIVITTLNHLFDGWFIAYCNIVEASQLLFQRDKKNSTSF